MNAIAKLRPKSNRLSAAGRINDAHRLAISAAGKAMITGVERAIEVGRLLAEEKEKHNHGEWLPWIEKNLEFDKRQTQNYLRAFNNRVQLKAQCTALLGSGLNSALKLLARPRIRPSKARRAARSRQDQELENLIAEQQLEDPDGPDVIDEINPENYRSAFLLRASQAIQFAIDCESLARNIETDDEVTSIVRRVADAWNHLSNDMEKRK